MPRVASTPALKFRQGSRSKAHRGFTLIEMLVSVVILVVLMAIIFQIIQLTSSAYKQSTQGTGTMQEARVAFERMTRTISQATLNTYYSYFYGNGTTSAPTAYMRQSELQFVSGYGPAAGGSTFITATTQKAVQVTHAIFFQAPLGVVNAADASIYGNLGNLLNNCGYFVIYGKDTAQPAFLNSAGFANAPPNPYRFRLMEYVQPSESFNLYTAGGVVSDGSLPPWIKMGIGDLTTTQTSVHSLASNIVALIVMPEQFSSGTSTNGQSNTTYVNSTGTSYTYDSAYNAQTQVTDPNTFVTTQMTTGNQLPPLVKVIMVAIDEASAARLAAKYSSATSTNPPDLGNLFTSSSGLFQDPSKLVNLVSGNGDLQLFEASLNGLKINYYVFQTDVIIRGAKWTSQ